MATYLTAEKKKELFAKHGGADTNSGAVESQIALFTYRIQSLSAHLRENKKDHSTRRSLLKLVGKRRRLLQYLLKKDITKYRAIIQELGIRK